MEATAELLFGELVILKEFFQEGIVGLGHQLDEFLVKRGDPFSPLPRQGLVGILAQAVGLVGEQLLTEHVGQLVKARPLVDGYGNREDLGAEPFPGHAEHGVKISVLLVQHVDHNEMGQAVVGGGIPYLLGAHLYVGNGVDHHHGEVGHPQGALHLAVKVGISGRVQDVELLARPG
ncbi:hypothetical protein ES703_67683 [subsurface metagenome]